MLPSFKNKKHFEGINNALVVITALAKGDREGAKAGLRVRGEAPQGLRLPLDLSWVGHSIVELSNFGGLVLVCMDSYYRETRRILQH